MFWEQQCVLVSFTRWDIAPPISVRPSRARRAELRSGPSARGGKEVCGGGGAAKWLTILIPTLSLLPNARSRRVDFAGLGRYRRKNQGLDRRGARS